MKTEAKSLIGTIVHENNYVFNKKKNRYKYLEDQLKPLAEEFKVFGLSTLTSEKLSRISTGHYEQIVAELDKKISEDIKSLPDSLKVTIEENRTKSQKRLCALLEKIRGITRNQEDIDLPCPEGVPTFTGEFEKQLKEQFTVRIQTEEQARFYERFLEAKQAIYALMNTGAVPGTHFELWNTGLALSGLV